MRSIEMLINFEPIVSALYEGRKVRIRGAYVWAERVEVEPSNYEYVCHYLHNGEEYDQHSDYPFDCFLQMIEHTVIAIPLYYLFNFEIETQVGEFDLGGRY
jgi:hypothetical protein